MVTLLIIWGFIGFLILLLCFFLDKGTGATSQNSTFLSWLFKYEKMSVTINDIIIYLIMLLALGPIGWFLAVNWAIVSTINKFLYK